MASQGREALGGYHVRVGSTVISCEHPRDETAPGHGDAPARRRPRRCVVQAQQQDAVESLLTPGRAVSSLPWKIRLMVAAMTLYFWNVPLSRIAQWLDVSNRTVYDWVMGQAVALFPTIQAWISERVQGACLLIDEKWLKIKERWR